MSHDARAFGGSVLMVPLCAAFNFRAVHAGSATRFVIRFMGASCGAALALRCIVQNSSDAEPVFFSRSESDGIACHPARATRGVWRKQRRVDHEETRRIDFFDHMMVAHAADTSVVNHAFVMATHCGLIRLGRDNKQGCKREAKCREQLQQSAHGKSPLRTGDACYLLS